jgi:hypothetical protein
LLAKKHSITTERCQEIYQDLNKEENVCKSHLDRSKIFSILTLGGMSLSNIYRTKIMPKRLIWSEMNMKNLKALKT